MQPDFQYCIEALPKVSRTFAPTIRLLPKGLDMPVTVAYLLFRIADTVEDSHHLSVEEKRDMLTVYSRIFSAESAAATEEFLMKIKALPQNTDDEKLVYDLQKVLSVFHTFSPAVQQQIGKWVVEMSVGMKKYAQELKKRRFTFLKTMHELEEYTYYVAGTVGYLLTELFSYSSKKITPQLKVRLEQFAESFGKGLQMVNIIRDMATDLRRGQSYIPDELLKKYHLTRDSIFKQENAARAEMMFNELIQYAVKHLDRAVKYILLIPKEETRIRLFCLLPLFWAMRTLQKIQENTLDLLKNEKIKITRASIRKEFWVALINMRSNRLMRRHYLNIRNDFKNIPSIPVSI
jgi:farnesyl-diphosphate farnesyltransferase